MDSINTSSVSFDGRKVFDDEGYFYKPNQIAKISFADFEGQFTALYDNLKSNYIVFDFRKGKKAGGSDNVVVESINSDITLTEEFLLRTELPQDVNGRILFEEVVLLDDHKKYKQNQLYINARKWFTDQYGNTRDILVLDFKEEGILVGSTFSRLLINSSLTRDEFILWYTITLQCRDGRYKYTINNLDFEPYPVTSKKNSDFVIPAIEIVNNYNLYRRNGSERPIVKSYKENLILEIDELIKSLKKGMASEELLLTNDTW